MTSPVARIANEKYVDSRMNALAIKIKKIRNFCSTDI
jgi:hypothetical protein